ncbi:MAG: GNAT family N-acetyltransferase [Hyphomicrobiales bacterium]|nr:GNAT family N-acetyltransferase [Hyphomicrobiales bacterium]
MSGAGQEITLERQGERGAYRLSLPDSDPARVTFVETAPNHIVIDYSWVPPRYRGRGLALKLVGHIVEVARRDGFWITPLCGYVAREFRSHPEWADVLEASR